MLELAMTSFVIGACLGAVLTYHFFNRTHALLLNLDARYSRIITLLSEWQKKI